MNEFLQRREQTDAENKQVRKQVEELLDRVEDLEQYMRKNCVEIQDVPIIGNENVINLVKKVGLAVVFEIVDNKVDNCHRLG